MLYVLAKLDMSDFYGLGENRLDFGGSATRLFATQWTFHSDFWVPWRHVHTLIMTLIKGLLRGYERWTFRY